MGDCELLSHVERYGELVKRLVAAIEVHVKEVQARLEASDRMMRRADELMAYRPVWPAPAGTAANRHSRAG